MISFSSTATPRSPTSPKKSDVMAMTTYLQPSDKIHLAFGISPHMSEQEQKARATELHQVFTDMYAAMGVILVGTTAIPGLKEPVVISVVRESRDPEPPRPVPPTPPHGKLPWKDPR